LLLGGFAVIVPGHSSPENDVVKLLLGMLKGLVIGAAIGYGAFALGLDGVFHWITYGAVGAAVGLLVGRPLWSLIFDRNATSLAGILKAVFGFGVGVGIYALVAKVWGSGGIQLALPIAEGERLLHDWQPLLGGAIGAVYGGFVEVDDSLDDSKARDAAKAAAAKAAPRPPKGK
jgi:hypothetical protein